jgi:hypothetical protein
MSMILQERQRAMDQDSGLRGLTFFGVTLGKVVSTNDPQQMGRLYVLCPELGDPPNMAPEDFESLPLCSYLSPLGGSTMSRYLRGPNDGEQSVGPISYGMWGIPKEGATVAVVCVDGNTNQRLWIGCIYDQFIVNTLPTGRFIVGQNGNMPDGPLTSSEQPIQPQYTNFSQAFGSRAGNFEWRTRGMDYQAAAVTESYVEKSGGRKSDDQSAIINQEDGSTVNVIQGYPETRNGTKSASPDSSVYSWTSPGFHSFSMDDRSENSRMKIRTSAGHQIILDDTNERIYISTAKGNNWIEIDEDGSIDIFSTEKISATGRHINLTAEETIRLYGKKGVHIRTDQDFRVNANNIHMTATTNVFTTSGGTNHTNAGGQIIETGSQIHMNGPTAEKAVAAFYTNRIPQHEPWARTSTKNDNTIEPKYPYNDPKVGREHKARGKYWRR